MLLNLFLILIRPEEDKYRIHERVKQMAGMIYKAKRKLETSLLHSSMMSVANRQSP
jgi:hypothetical protein